MRKFLAFSALSLLASCSTAEFQAEESTCASEWTKKIPPVYRQITVQKTRAIQVPSGNVTCNTFGYGYTATTNCTQQMRTEYIPYTVVETVDLQKTERDGQIKMCTIRACSQKYGNAECKPVAQ